MGREPVTINSRPSPRVPRDRVQAERVTAGCTMRIYLPFAEDWHDALSYLRCRMMESPSMAMLVVKNLLTRSS
jgi:hypothetical protein